MRLYPHLRKKSLKFAQDVALNFVWEKVKPPWKISYKVSKVQYGYNPLIDISPYTTLNQLTEFLGDVQHCVTVVGKYIFDIDIPLALPINNENLGYCCTTDDK